MWVMITKGSTQSQAWVSYLVGALRSLGDDQHERALATEYRLFVDDAAACSNAGV